MSNTISSNIKFVQEQINMKKSNTPYYATTGNVKQVVSNINHHPYTHFFQGKYYSNDSIIISREAGYIPDSEYNVIISTRFKYPK